jgi:hypothetical protein
MAMTRPKCNVCLIVVVATAAFLGAAAHRQQPPPAESERRVTEAEVPKPALATLKKQAGGAAITEFAEEIEHGHTFYEGSWKGANGHVDCLVTAAGALVEIEESVAADSVPESVREAASKAAGAGVKPDFEKKTLILYEIHFTKDGKVHEAIFTADGRTYHEEAGDEAGGEEDERKEPQES